MAMIGALTGDVAGSAAPPILARQCRTIPHGAAVPGKYYLRAALPLSDYPPSCLPSTTATCPLAVPTHPADRATAAGCLLRLPCLHATTATMLRTIA